MKQAPKRDSADVLVGAQPRTTIPRIDNITYRLLKASPEAIALRTLAIQWKETSDKDGLDHSPGCSHERAAERAHRRFMQAAYEYGCAVQRRGKEHMHLWARPGELIDFTRNGRVQEVVHRDFEGGTR